MANNKTIRRCTAADGIGSVNLILSRRASPLLGRIQQHLHPGCPTGCALFHPFPHQKAAPQKPETRPQLQTQKPCWWGITTRMRPILCGTCSRVPETHPATDFSSDSCTTRRNLAGLGFGHIAGMGRGGNRW